MKNNTKISIDELNKGNIWTLSAHELSQLILDGKKQKREEFLENEKHYMNIIRTVFDIKYFNREDSNKIQQFEQTGYEIFSSPDEGGNNAIAIRKHPLKKVTDLTLENIQHLDAWEVLDLIKNNLGTGWKGLPLAIQDIIESAFFVDCVVMPHKTLHKEGGIIERRQEDGYEVLEMERGNWVEAIFMKMKPKVEKIHIDFSIPEEDENGKRRKKRGRKSKAELAELNSDDDEFDDEIYEEEEDIDDNEDDDDVEEELNDDKYDDDELDDDLDDKMPGLEDLEDIEDVEAADPDEED